MKQNDNRSARFRMKIPDAASHAYATTSPTAWATVSQTSSSPLRLRSESPEDGEIIDGDEDVEQHTTRTSSLASRLSRTAPISSSDSSIACTVIQVPTATNATIPIVPTHKSAIARKDTTRPTTDYGTSMVQWMLNRRQGYNAIEQERPSLSYMIDMLPPIARKAKPADTIPAKHLHSSLNKIKHPVNVVKWTPEGRRLLTGSSSGEFTLWNGMGFNFETIMSAHETAIRSVAWSHSDEWLISSDQSGIVKYWQPNFNNLKVIQAHEQCVRDLAFAPTDSKYVTASDDSTIKLWDFANGIEEATFTGHGWDVKCIDWHPHKGLIVSGSRDHLVKLWDPRTGKCLTSLHGHKNTVSKTLFDPIRGHMLATSARNDPIARIMDIRMMRDVLLLKTNDKEVMTLAWHPVHHSLLTAAGSEGSLNHFLLDEPNLPEGTPMTKSPYDTRDPKNAPAQTIYPAHTITYAHESAVWSLDWHPVGHILTSGSNDRVTRFWTRPRPGETEWANDRYHLGDSAAKAHGAWTSKVPRHFGAREGGDEDADDEAEALVDQKMPTKGSMVPGLPGLRDGTSVGGGQSLLPGIGLTAPPPPSQSSSAQYTSSFSMPPQILGMPPIPPPGFDMSLLHNPAEFQKMLGNMIPPPPMPGQMPGQFPPPPPGFAFPGGMPIPPPGFPVPPPGFVPPPPGFQAPAANGDPRRNRAPLPSQQESLENELRHGRVSRVAR